MFKNEFTVWVKFFVFGFAAFFVLFLSPMAAAAAFVESEEVMEAQPPSTPSIPVETPEGEATPGEAPVQNPAASKTPAGGKAPGVSSSQAAKSPKSGEKKDPEEAGKPAEDPAEDTPAFTVPGKPVYEKHLSVPAGLTGNPSLEEESKEDMQTEETAAYPIGKQIPTGALVTMGLLLLAAGIFRIITQRKGEQDAAT